MWRQRRECSSSRRPLSYMRLCEWLGFKASLPAALTTRLMSMLPAEEAVAAGAKEKRTPAEASSSGAPPQAIEKKKRARQQPPNIKKARHD